jgi:hypothetical protein
MPAKSLFLSIRILEVLAEQPPYMALSLEEIVQALRDPDVEEEGPEAWIWEVAFGRRGAARIPLHGQERIVELCLLQLAAADLIVGEDLKQGGKRWRVVPRWPGRNGGGRNDGREPPLRDTGGDGGDGGGGGIREVLAHPRLFALGDEDFDALLDRATGIEP